MIKRTSWGAIPLLVFLFITSISTTWAGNKEDVRRPPKGFIESISDGDEFEYTTYEAEVNWIQGLLNLLSETFGGALSANGWLILLKVLAICSFLAILIFLINKMMQGDLGQTIKGAKKLGPENLSILGENVHDLDLEQLILETTSQGKFRLALRYTYLSVLKNLSEKGLIEWKKDKTNKEYGKELLSAAPDHAQGYLNITQRFEYLWYGQSEVNREVFDENQEVFQAYNLKIKRT